MRMSVILGVVAVVGIALATSTSARQASNGDAHVVAAKAAAGDMWPGLFDRVCGQVTAAPASPGAGGGPAQAAPARRGGPPDRSAWHAEPVKVFDNLYFLGQTEYSVWAVTTSAGIIVLDTI